jgi:hypothetical protein
MSITVLRFNSNLRSDDVTFASKSGVEVFHKWKTFSRKIYLRKDEKTY